LPRPDVIHVLPHAYPLGGTERTVLDLLSSPWLTDLDQRVVFLRGGSLGPFAVERVLARSPKPRQNLMRAAREVLTARPRILHGWLLRGNVFAAALGVVLPSTHVLTSERNVGHALKTPFKRMLERFVAAREHTCIVNSAAVAEAAAARIPGRRAQIRVILPGIEEPSRDGRRTPCTCLTVGRLEPVKDHITLLKAWPRVLSRHPDASLILLGEGPERAALESAIRELGIEASVELLGDRDPFPFLRTAQAYVSTSRAEGFSRAVLEALAMGVPVISTDVGGVDHIPADAVRRVAVGDVEAVARAISDFLSDEAVRARASHAGLSAFRRYFTRDRCHLAYRDLYAACVR
jgi:glycosyltransferase involved in cell wall biosynthesis